MTKPNLTIDLLCEEAGAFQRLNLNTPNRLYGVTDGVAGPIW